MLNAIPKIEGRGRRYKYDFSAWEVNDTYQVTDNDNYLSMMVCARRYAKLSGRKYILRTKEGVRYIIRKA